MRRGLFGETGYGLTANGTETTVQKIQVADVKQFHQRLAVPGNCVLAIFGDVQTDAVRTAVQKRFGAWKKRPAPLPQLPHSPRLHKVKHLVKTRDKKQAVLVVGFPGAALDNPDRFALELVQEACSDLGSRLFMRIREKLGLAYYVGAQNFLGLTPGFFAFYAGTEPEKIELVENELLQEAQTLRETGLTAEELKRSKAKVIGQKKIARQDLGGLAMTAALDELYGLGYGFIDTEDAKYEAVTLDQVKAVAQKHLTPGALVISIVKPEKPQR